MYNKVIMMGRIANDLELKTTPNGHSVCSFRIAVDRRFKTQDGKKQTDFFNAVVWNQTAEMVTKWFSKGRMILVEGEMTTRQYTDKNGNNATWYEINAERVSFTGEKRDDGNTHQTSDPPNYGAAQAPQDNYAAVADADDDYPF